MTSQSRNLRSGLAYTREPSPSDASDASCSSRCHLADGELRQSFAFDGSPMIVHISRVLSRTGLSGAPTDAHFSVSVIRGEMSKSLAGYT